jgi:hypothetical protein
MNFTQIRDFVTAKVSKTDTYSQDRCLDYVKARHKMIYEGFDWKTAQIIVEKTISSGSTVTTVTVPEVHHCLSVRLDSNLLDPVSASFIFEHSTSAKDDYSTAGVPRYYEEFQDPVSGNRSIRLFPPLADTGANHSLVILGKAPYGDAWTSPAIPQTENALVAYVTGDMWEYLHQVGKAQAKFQEAALIMQAAQAGDTPVPLRPRMSKRLTATGNSLSEMADAVCDIVGDYSPQARNSIKDRIRRNHQSIWDFTLWPESTILVPGTALNGIVILPHLLDKVVSVRVNVTTPDNVRSLSYADSEIFFGVQPTIFESTGVPVNYNNLLPVGLPVSINESNLKIVLTGSEKANAFIKGELRNVDAFETIAASNTAVISVQVYDTVYTIFKPVTKYSLQVKDLSDVVLMELGPNEQSRQYPRIRVYPSFDPMADQSVLVLGKRRIPQMLDDLDAPVLTGIENILINSSASDVLLHSKPDVAAALKQKADSLMQILIDRETKQATYTPRVLPYVEPSGWGYADFDY